MTTAEREAAALEAVRDVFPGAVYIWQTHPKGVPRPKPVLELAHDCCLEWDGWEYVLWPNRGYFTPRAMRAVLRALGILNGVDE